VPADAGRADRRRHAGLNHLRFPGTEYSALATSTPGADADAGDPGGPGRRRHTAVIATALTATQVGAPGVRASSLAAAVVTSATTGSAPAIRTRT
jgi:hypothetical protein